MSVWSLTSITICLVLLALMLIKPRMAVSWLLATLLLSPYIDIGGLRFRIELVLVPLMLGVVAVQRQGRLIIPRLAWLASASWVWVFVVTALDMVFGVAGRIPWATLYGAFRPVLIVLLYYNSVYDREDVLRFLRWFVNLAIPLGLFALAQVVNSRMATVMTLQGYTSLSRTPVMNMLGDLGRIGRGVSVFESPPYAAVYFLLALGTGVLLLSWERPTAGFKQVWLWVSVCISALAGLATNSSTFLLGAGILLAWLAIRVRLPNMLRLAMVVLVLCFSVSAMVVVLGGQNEDLAGFLDYQAQRIGSLSVFQTRYGNSGILTGTLEAINQRPLQGWGWLERERSDIFVGDSYYVSTLYIGGSVGLLLSLLPLLYILRLHRHTGLPGEIMLLWLALLLATGVGTPSFSIPRVQDWYWAMGASLAWAFKHKRTLHGEMNMESTMVT